MSDCGPNLAYRPPGVWSYAAVDMQRVHISNAKLSLARSIGHGCGRKRCRDQTVALRCRDTRTRAKAKEPDEGAEQDPKSEQGPAPQGESAAPPKNADAKNSFDSEADEWGSPTEKHGLICARHFQSFVRHKCACNLRSGSPISLAVTSAAPPEWQQSTHTRAVMSWR